jgi:RNA polymerase primary sigma factor
MAINPQTWAEGEESPPPEATQDNGVELYLKDLRVFSREYPLLSAEEEKDLGRRARGGDELARRRLINSNLRLVFRIALRYSMRSGISVMELNQEGYAGLDRASKKFDPEKGYRFSTYASRWIQNFIGRYIDDHSRTIRITAEICVKIRRVNRKRLALRQALGRMPTDEELARACDVTLEKLEVVRQAEKEMLSFDARCQEADNDGNDLYDMVPADQPPTEDLALRAISARDYRIALDETIPILSKREWMVLGLRFGDEDHDPWTLEQIGQKLGVTRERIRQIETKACKKLEEALKDQGVTL